MAGPTFGLEPGSYRAESYGMLSLMLFLDHYFCFFHVQVSENVDHLFYCDNQGLIKRIELAIHRSRDNPNHCLSSKYDLESGIVDILHRLPVTFSFNHVKGHQDEDTPVKDLPWEAQMNCHADTYATESGGLNSFGGITWTSGRGLVGEPDFIVLLDVQVTFQRVGKGSVFVIEVSVIRAVDGKAREDDSQNRR